MPVGINSPARNLFLLGSSGQAAVTNFFETIDQSAGTDGVYLPAEIKYIFSNQKYALAGSAQDSNAVSFGWFERQDYDIETGLLTTDYTNKVVNTQSLSTTLFAMELDANENLIVGGKTGDVPWIAKYSNDGVLDWQSTTNSADVEYSGIASNSSGNYYACGSTQSPNPQQAFVEKFDANGNPGWGKSAFMLGRHVMLDAIDANSRGQVVAVGHLEDDSSFKGYIVKIDTNTGEVLWDRTLDAGDGITLSDVFIDSNDQIYIVGTSLGAAVEGYIFKYTAEGNLIWQRKTNGSSLDSFTFDRVKSDGETEQTIVFGTYFDMNGNDLGGVLSKYAKDGSLVWRRTIFSSNNNSDSFSDVCLDADPSFYYLLYVDTEIDGLAGTPDSYTFGKVSSSGNGLGGFQYAEGTGETIDYQILNIGDTISRVSDGAVRNDSSDLITYPFTGNKIVFDDLSTQVSNKKRQMDDADSFEYSGSPAIRPADFQELNLLGDVYSGSGDWLDQSGKGNNATTTFTTTAEEPFSGAGSVEFDGPTDGASVGTGYVTISSSNTSDFNFGTGDFTWEAYIYGEDWTGGSANQDQFVIAHMPSGSSDISGFFVEGGQCYYYSNKASSRFIITGPVLQDRRWYHVAASRESGTLRLFIDGTSVGSASYTDDYAAAIFTLGRNEDNDKNQFRGYISNFRVISGTAVYTSNFTPPTSALTNTGQTTGTDYYTGSEWSPAGINAPEDAFTASTAGSGGNGGNFGPFTYTFATPVTGVTSARIRGALGASVGQVGGTTNVILVDGTDVTQKFKNAGLYTTVGWVDVTAEVGSTWNSFRVQGISGSTNPNVSGVEVNGVQLLSSPPITGTVLLTAQGSSITDASDSSHSIATNGSVAAAVGGTNTVAYNAAGKYFEFDGTDKKISVPYNDAWTLPGDFTLEAWIYRNSAFDASWWRDAIMGHDDGGGNNNKWIFSHSGTSLFFHTNTTAGSAQYIQAPTGWVPTNSEWYNVVVTRSGNTYTFYQNSTSLGSVTNSSAIPAASASLTIGNAEGGGLFDGRFGEVRIYPRALTAAAVFQNYNATRYKYDGIAPNTSPRIGPGIVYDGLVLNYDFGNEFCIERLGTIQG